MVGYETRGEMHGGNGFRVTQGRTNVAVVALETRRSFGPDEDGQRAYEASVREELTRRKVGGDQIALNRLPTAERLLALESIQWRKREADQTQSAVPGGVVMTERLLRAAQAIVFHAEFVPVRLVSAAGAVTACQLVGAGQKPGTALVRRWWDKKPAGRPVRLEEIALPADVAARLEAVAAEQS
jgi:hypothetical protein